LAGVLLFSLLGWATEIAQLHFVLGAFGLPADTATATLILIGINAAVALPGPPANFGTFEAGAGRGGVPSGAPAANGVGGTRGGRDRRAVPVGDPGTDGGGVHRRVPPASRGTGRDGGDDRVLRARRVGYCGTVASYLTPAGSGTATGTIGAGPPSVGADASIA